MLRLNQHNCNVLHGDRVQRHLEDVVDAEGVRDAPARARVAERVGLLAVGQRDVTPRY